MQTLPKPLEPLAAYKQFILYDNEKVPVHYKTLDAIDPHNPANRTDADTALHYANAHGNACAGIGFVFTANDPFWFVDIDGALQPDNTWSPVALELLRLLPGAAVEISRSGTGLHIIGSGTPPAHSCKNASLNLEFYTELRYCALTGVSAQGSVSVDLTPQISAVAAGYFPVKNTSGAAWSDKPVPEWNGTDNDEELIKQALSVVSAGSVFGGVASFSALWGGGIDALSTAYPPNPNSQTAYDASTADAALAQHLAFWTGNNHERIKALMLQSALKRDKWDREDYLIRTITRAVSLQETVYTAGAADNTIAETNGAPKLKSSSEKQRQFAENIRAKKLKECGQDTELITLLCKQSTAKFWIDNKDIPVVELGKKITPITTTSDPMASSNTPTVITGYQYLPAELQIKHFAGCVYIQDLHRIFTPSGSMLKSEQFNATYGGYVFQVDESGGNTTRKAWEAFTESQVVRFPKAESLCFKPMLTPGAIIMEEGRALVNTYVPVEVRRITGDPAPFLNLLKKILPVEQDQKIILAYMAACVQYKGYKFQWAPLLQGVEGNGKTVITRCIVRAIGKRYAHFPKAADIDNKFNSWLLNKLFIGVEDIHVPGHRQEIIEALKPMITSGDGLEIQMKGVDQVTTDICANFMFNSNHKDAIPATGNRRRFAIFYTAQQAAEDLIRDGMGGNYFPDLYKWLKADGYAIVSDYLYNYEIPAELNPATECQRAPETSTTQEAISMSRGSVEQEIMEAIDENRPGFAGGWISSMALHRLLENMKMSRMIPHNKRRELLKTLGYSWHPALSSGRVNAHINLDGGKPRLFIRDGHLGTNLETSKEISAAYEAAQSADSSKAESIFGITKG